MSKEIGISPEEQPTTKPSSKPQNSTVPTWKKRWHFKGLIVVTSLNVLIVTIYLLRSAIFPNYLGLVVALCVVAFGLFLVRGVIRMLAEFDKLQDQQTNVKEAAISPLEANLDGEKRIVPRAHQNQNKP
jgi:hypothetical protein